MKQFVNLSEARRHINTINSKIQEEKGVAVTDMLLTPEKAAEPDPEEGIKILEAEGYNVDDLVANNEYYMVFGHTNNGWKTKEDSRYIPSYNILKCTDETEQVMDDVRTVTRTDYVCSVMTSDPEGLKKLLKNGYELKEYEKK